MKQVIPGNPMGLLYFIFCSTGLSGHPFPATTELQTVVINATGQS
jgi:hypothetical protein